MQIRKITSDDKRCDVGVMMEKDVAGRGVRGGLYENSRDLSKDLNGEQVAGHKYRVGKSAVGSGSSRCKGHKQNELDVFKGQKESQGGWSTVSEDSGGK